MFECERCKKVFEKNFSLYAHYSHCSNSRPIKRMKPAWNKNLTKETNSSVSIGAKKLRARYASGEITPFFKGKKLLDSTKSLISKKMMGNKNYSPDRVGYGLKGWKYGIHCSSLYELVYVIYCKENNISIVRNTKFFIYEEDGVFKKYYPDFIINNEFVEIKGFHTKTVDLKMKAVLASGCLIKVLYLEDLKFCFEYVYDKHKVNYNSLRTLYDVDSRLLNSVCEICGEVFKHFVFKRTCSKLCWTKLVSKNNKGRLCPENALKKLIGHNRQNGEKNSQYGTKWIIHTSTGEIKKCKSQDIKNFLARGWKLGKKL